MAEILEVGRASLEARRKRVPLPIGAGSEAVVAKRKRKPNVFEIVRSQNIQTVTDFQELACKLAEEGDTHLAEFATTHGKKLGAFIASARDVLDAPRRAIEAKKTLLDKLMRASREAPCKCAGQWQPGAALVLQNQRIPIADFCCQFLWALGLGAARGVIIALVGRGGCGKSMLFEPLELIFTCASKPQKGNTKFSIGGAAWGFPRCGRPKPLCFCVRCSEDV